MTNDFISQLRSSKGLKTGTGATISLRTLIAIYSLAMVTSLPGLAVSPILEELRKVFHNASDFELQMLESLPSFVIIPFILLAGQLSLNISIRRLVLFGLSIFVLSSIVYLMPIGIGLMLFNSALLGVGAGLIIPFTTGLIAHYFTASQRTQQLGIISGISNFSLVIATALTGYLANIEWHLPFLVYSISIVSLILASRMKRTNRTEKEKSDMIEASKKSYSLAYIKKQWPVSLMVFYFVMTIIVLPIPMNLSLLLAHYNIGSDALSGILISVFFLSVTIPGFFINKLIGSASEKNNLIWIGIITLGSIFIMFHSLWSIVVGVILMGLGYGVIQPLVYDRTSERTTVSRVTFNLSLVMSMNYLAIVLYPFIQSLIQHITINEVMTPMYMSLVLGVSYWSYYLYKSKKQVT